MYALAKIYIRYLSILLFYLTLNLNSAKAGSVGDVIELLSKLTCETEGIGNLLIKPYTHTCIQDPFSTMIVAAIISPGMYPSIMMRLRIDDDKNPALAGNCLRRNRANPDDPRITFGLCANYLMIAYRAKIIGYSIWASLFAGNNPWSEIEKLVDSTAYTEIFSNKQDGDWGFFADVPLGSFPIFPWKVLVHGDRICVDTISLVGWMHVGCKYIAEPFPRSIYGSFFNNPAANPLAIPAEMVDYLSCATAGGCAARAEAASKAPITISSTIMECIREMLIKLVISKDVCVLDTSAGRNSQVMNRADNAFYKFQLNMHRAVMALLTLYVMFIGFKILMGGDKLPKPSEFIMYVLKLVLVIYFSVGINIKGTEARFDGMTQLVFPLLYNAAAEMAIWVMNATPSGLCQFLPKDYVPSELGYLALWDALDCKVIHYIGIDAIMTVWQGQNSGDPLGYNIPPYVFLLIPAIYFQQINLVILAISYPLIVISLAAFLVNSFAVCMIAITILGVLAPVFVPMALFEQTKSYFEGWYTLMISFVLQPVVVIGFMTLLFALYDMGFYGTCLYKSFDMKKTTAQGVEVTKKLFVINVDKDDYESEASYRSCQESIGYILNNPLGSLAANIASQSTGNTIDMSQTPAAEKKIADFINEFGALSGITPVVGFFLSYVSLLSQISWSMIVNLMTCCLLLYLMYELSSQLGEFAADIAQSVTLSGVISPRGIADKANKLAKKAGGALAKLGPAGGAAGVGAALQGAGGGGGEGAPSMGGGGGDGLTGGEGAPRAPISDSVGSGSGAGDSGSKLSPKKGPARPAPPSAKAVADAGLPVGTGTEPLAKDATSSSPKTEPPGGRPVPPSAKAVADAGLPVGTGTEPLAKDVTSSSPKKEPPGGRPTPPSAKAVADAGLPVGTGTEPLAKDATSSSPKTEPPGGRPVPPSAKAVSDAGLPVGTGTEPLAKANAAPGAQGTTPLSAEAAGAQGAQAGAQATRPLSAQTEASGTGAQVPGATGAQGTTPLPAEAAGAQGAQAGGAQATTPLSAQTEVSGTGAQAPVAPVATPLSAEAAGAQGAQAGGAQATTSLSAQTEEQGPGANTSGAAPTMDNSGAAVGSGAELAGKKGPQRPPPPSQAAIDAAALKKSNSGASPDNQSDKPKASELKESEKNGVDPNAAKANASSAPLPQNEEAMSARPKPSRPAPVAPGGTPSSVAPTSSASEAPKRRQAPVAPGARQPAGGSETPLAASTDQGRSTGSASVQAIPTPESASGTRPSVDKPLSEPGIVPAQTQATTNPSPLAQKEATTNPQPMRAGTDTIAPKDLKSDIKDLQAKAKGAAQYEQEHADANLANAKELKRMTKEGDTTSPKYQEALKQHNEAMAPIKENRASAKEREMTKSISGWQDKSRAAESGIQAEIREHYGGRDHNSDPDTLARLALKDKRTGDDSLGRTLKAEGMTKDSLMKTEYVKDGKTMKFEDIVRQDPKLSEAFGVKAFTPEEKTAALKANDKVNSDRLAVDKSLKKLDGQSWKKEESSTILPDYRGGGVEKEYSYPASMTEKMLADQNSGKLTDADRESRLDTEFTNAKGHKTTLRDLIAKDQVLSDALREAKSKSSDGGGSGGGSKKGKK